MPASQSLGGESPGVRIGALRLALHPRPPGAQRKHKVFSHLSVVSPQAGGAAALSRKLVAPKRQEHSPCSSHLCFLSVPPLEKTGSWRFKKRRMVCVEGGGSRGCRGGGGVAEGHWGVVRRLPWCGFGVMADTGEMACLPELSTTAALCGRRQLTAGFQTITLNICKQIKKQTRWAQKETSAFLHSALFPSPLFQGFPRGRSGWLLTPQSSPDSFSSTILPP